MLEIGAQINNMAHILTLLWSHHSAHKKKPNSSDHCNKKNLPKPTTDVYCLEIPAFCSDSLESRGVK